jgi:alanine racemase
MALSELRIDLGAISWNLARIREKVGPHRKVVAMVKADAYGHGAVEVARHLTSLGVARLGVALTEEAIRLRQAGIGCPIWVLQPCHRHDLEPYQRYDLEATLQGGEDVSLLADSALPFHIMVDSGMGREGLPLTDLPALVDALRGKALQPLSLGTHFAAADNPASGHAERQWREFSQALAGLTLPAACFYHAANSAAILNLPQSHADAVRPGILLYGQYQGAGSSWQKPAMSLWARLALVKRLPAGHGVGYGPVYSTAKETHIGILSVGYGDGYLRSVPGPRWISWQERRFPVVGRVSMDQITADLGDHPPPPGVWCSVLSPEQIRQEADALGTIAYERCCQLGLRATKVYRKEEPCC